MFGWFKRKHETRSDPSWQGLSHQGPPVGGTNPKVAENLSTVLACVSAISTAIGSLPAWVYTRTDAGRQVDPAHPLMRLVRLGANDYQTWPEFMEWITASTLLRGNGLAEVRRDNAGRVTALIPIPWEWASVHLLPTGRLAYDVTDVQHVYGGSGRTRRLLQDEVMHLRDRSDDGLIGRSRLDRARSVVSAGMEIQDYAEQMFGNAATPSGVIEADGKIDTEAMNKLKRQFREAYTGTKNARKAMLLDQGLKFKPISVSPEDAELLASRRFTVEELARIYQVPPPIVGDLSHGTFTNTETVGRWFAQHTLTPWIRKIEAEMLRSVFTERSRIDHEFELDLSGFLRGDPEQRWASHKIAVEANILDTDEIREIEGFRPRGAA